SGVASFPRSWSKPPGRACHSRNRQDSEGYPISARWGQMGPDGSGTDGASGSVRGRSVSAQPPGARRNGTVKEMNASSRRSRSGGTRGGSWVAPHRLEAALAAPLFAYVLAFTVVPLLDTVRLSLTAPLGAGFPSLASYRAILDSDVFRAAVANTLVVTL